MEDPEVVVEKIRLAEAFADAVATLPTGDPSQEVGKKAWLDSFKQAYDFVSDTISGKA